ncbi:MAG: TonB-dependent receptor [Odoribacter sp.]
MKKSNKWKNIFLMTKCTVFLLLFFVIGVKANVFSQREVVSLRMEKVSLVDVFDQLEKITGVQFLYNADLVKGKGQINVDVAHKPFQDFLNEVLLPRGLEYSFKDNQVVVRKAVLQSQPIVLKGKVTDQKGEPLPGTTVRIDGTTIGTATDANGEFAMRLSADKGILVFTFVGFKEKKVNYTSDKYLVVKLEPESSNLNEVTVVGYGSRKKREVVGAISTVKGDDIKEVPSPSLETLLQGRVAGLAVFQQSGAPGSGGNSVTIRGYNSLLDDEAGFKSNGSPLYVIDGVPVHSFTSPVTGTNTIAEIDPTTIESVEVLKDAASAAIYGSRAANGVILITTKKGRTGRGKFSANISYSGSILPEAPTQIGGRGERMYHIGMLESAKKAYYNPITGEYKYPTSKEEAALNNTIYDIFWNKGLGVSSGGVMKILQDSLNPFFNNSTNWYKYIFRPGKIWNANLQTSGGTETTNYLIGAGFYKEIGIMPGSDFIRANLLSNVSVKPLKNLTIDSRMYLAYTDRSRGSGSIAGVFEELTVNPQSTSTLLPGGGDLEEIMLKKLNGKIESNTSYRLRGNLVLGYEIIDGLNLSTSASIDYNQANLNTFAPNYLDPTYHESKSAGEVGRDMLLSNENLLNYQFSLAEKHNFDLLLGFSFDRSKTWSIGGYGIGAPSNSIEYVGNSFPEMIYNPVSGEYRSLQKYYSDFSETSMVSYFGRIAYNYEKKYLLEATFRRDGSSVFGSDERWATFPSIAAGWAFSEENFMRWAWWIDFAKFRASWGRTGSQFTIPYLAQGLMESGSVFEGVQGMRPAGITNHKLQWEESDQYDFGLDMDMLDYRMSLTLDYYYKYTRSLIYKVPLPGDVYGEGGMQWQNAMEVSNEGLELDLKIDVLRNTALTWRARFNISKNWNRFEKSYSGVDAQGMVIGKALSGIYLYKDGGLIQSEADLPYVYDEEGKKHILAPEGEEEYFYTLGMRKIQDLDGDGQITEDDVYYAGSALPTVYGGFASELKWKDFDLNFLLSFTLGRKMVNAFKMTTLNSTGGGSKPLFSDVSSSDFWQKPGDQTRYPAQGVYPVGSAQFMGMLSSDLETVSYVKLKQLTLGYNVPKKALKKVHLDGVRVFVTGENLFMLSNYSGLDPEVVNVHNGFDSGRAYPLARKWTIGLTVNF